MTTTEDIEKAIARLTAEAKLCAWLDEIEARLLDVGIERDAMFGSRADQHRPRPGTDLQD